MFSGVSLWFYKGLILAPCRLASLQHIAPLSLVPLWCAINNELWSTSAAIQYNIITFSISLSTMSKIASIEAIERVCSLLHWKSSRPPTPMWILAVFVPSSFSGGTFQHFAMYRILSLENAVACSLFRQRVWKSPPGFIDCHAPLTTAIWIWKRALITCKNIGRILNHNHLSRRAAFTTLYQV